MLLALNPDQTRVRATPTERARCPACRSEVRAKCGRQTIWHWAHLSRDCDPFSEPMTAWHRDWQAAVPEQCREVVIGPHRADVRTPAGVVVEFQHSAISAPEIEEREAFYGPSMVWVFDAVEACNREAHNVWVQVIQQRRDLLASEIAAHPVGCQLPVHFDDWSGAPLPAGVLWDESVVRCAGSDKGWPPDEPPRRLQVGDRGQRADGYTTFRWKHARKSLAACQRPVFLDLGNNELLRLGRIHLGPPCGGWGHVWSRDAFVAQLNATGGQA